MFTNTAASAVSTYTIYLSRCWLCSVSNNATIASDYYYDIGYPYILIYYGSWVNDYAADCGAVNLLISFANSSMVPASGFAITQDASINSLKVYTTSLADASSYTINFDGQAGTYDIWLNQSTTVHILIPCNISFGSSNFSASTYTVNS